MQTAISIRELRKFRSTMRGKIGFIPTMGYLHKGHISLVQLAQKQNDHVIVSIFVNPTQFGRDEDFTMYPRNEERDLQLLGKANVTTVFLPTVEEIYPSGYETYVAVENLSKKLEGEKRPGHFKGVATVLSKLFNIIQPTSAYFGQKDAQQVVVVKKMVADLQIPVEIVVGPTKREQDGLALSSRNVYLSKEEHREAAILFRSLSQAQKLFQKGECDVKKIKREMENLIKTTSGQIDYISVADPDTFDELKIAKEHAVISLAVYFGKTRLIDNCIL